VHTKDTYKRLISSIMYMTAPFYSPVVYVNDAWGKWRQCSLSTNMFYFC
jgi:hypothetical protein